MMSGTVRLGASSSSGADDALLEELAAAARAAGRDVGAALDLATAWGSRLPRPGRGRTPLLWEVLATLGAMDQQVARVVEPHLDALAILDELGVHQEADRREVPASRSWGVFAAEARGMGLQAETTHGRWSLTGTKAWCSLADRVTHALVTAWRGEQRGLFAVDLGSSGVSTGAAAGGADWVARGLPGVHSTEITLAGVPAIEVGGPGWYITRDGFAWGGMGVAAVWYGGAVAAARRLARQAAERELDQIGLHHLGAVDIALHAARVALFAAAEAIDTGQAGGAAGAVLALRTRGVVVRTVEEVQRRCDHALGPGPLVADEEYAALVADLHLYVRQHHAERDDAALGRNLLPGPPW